MGATAAGITGGNPIGFTVTERVTPVTERVYGIAPTIKDVKTGNAANAWGPYIVFDQPTLYVLVECWTNNLAIQVSTDGGSTYEDTREVDINRAVIIPFTATGFRVRRYTSGSASRYQVTGIGTGF